LIPAKLRKHLTDRRVAVTGANGFIGKRLVRHLVDAGADITVLVRSKPVGTDQHGAAVKTVIGGLQNAGALAECLERQDVVFNLAYDTRASGAANLAAFDTLLTAARSANVGRIVHMSSIVVYDAWPDADIDESATINRPGGGPYRQAKIAMEQRLMAGNVPAAILQPTIVYGPGSQLWTDKLARALTRGAIVLPMPEGLCNGVYVDDVVQAALCAATVQDLGQERFVISGDRPFLWSDLLKGYAQITGRGQIRHKPFADLAARLGPEPDPDAGEDTPSVAARVSALARRILGHEKFERILLAVGQRLAKDGDMYPDHHLLAEFSNRGTCQIGKAVKRLGYSPAYDLAKGLEATAGHLQKYRGDAA
jgi:nucleoside-diphosphate-sugar epimerase